MTLVLFFCWLYVWLVFCVETVVLRFAVAPLALRVLALRCGFLRLDRALAIAMAQTMRAAEALQRQRGAD